MRTFSRNLLLAGALALCSAPSLAIDFIVNSNADVPEESPGNGLCNPVGAVAGVCTLRAAIMESNANPGEHNIILASDVYVLSNTGVGEDAGITGDLDIHGNINIFNASANRPSISGGFSDRVFDIHPAAILDLDNVDVGAGRANVPGTVRGGAFNVRGNVNDSGALFLSRADVSSNIANIGGAIYNDGIVFVSSVEFFNNVITDANVDPQFADGAAILNRRFLLIGTSTFRRNGLIPGGEGQFLAGEYAIHSKRGFFPNPFFDVRNSTIYDNTNGIFSDGVPSRIAFVTIADNNQRGLRFLRDIDNLGQLQLSIDKTVIVGHAGDCNGIPSADPEFNVASNVNASSDESCGFTGFNSFENIADPFPGELADNGGNTTTLLPALGSVVIDPIGSTCSDETPDQRGLSRPLDGDNVAGAFCDIGAVEVSLDVDYNDIFADGFEP